MWLPAGTSRIYRTSLPDEFRASGSIAPLPRDDGLVSDSCSSGPTFADGFLPTIPHDNAVALGLQFRSSRPTGNSNPTNYKTMPGAQKRAVSFTLTAPVIQVNLICALPPASLDRSLVKD